MIVIPKKMEKDNEEKKREKEKRRRRERGRGENKRMENEKEGGKNRRSGWPRSSLRPRQATVAVACGTLIGPTSSVQGGALQGTYWGVESVGDPRKTGVE